MSGCEVMRTERAQWRGLEFEWIDESHSGENRLAIHNYVDRDTHSVKPIGVDADRWTVRGYICGERLRDRVREFRESFRHSQRNQSSGRLYDPWQNEDFDVYVANWTITPTSNILGTEFSVTFVDAGEDPFPVATQSPLAAFADAIEQLEIDSVAAFSGTFSVMNARAGSVGGAISDADAAWTYIRESYQLGYEPGAAIDLTGLTDFEVISQAHAANLETIFDAVDEAFGDARALLFYVRNIYIDLGAIDPLGPAAAAAIENNVSLAALIARTSFARAAAVIINNTYPTREHAQQAVDQLATYADALRRFDNDCEDATVSRDVQCILAIASQIPAQFPALKIWTTTKRQSALALAHDIYCDIGRANELADLNNALTALPFNPCYAAA